MPLTLRALGQALVDIGDVSLPNNVTLHQLTDKEAWTLAQIRAAPATSALLVHKQDDVVVSIELTSKLRPE